MHRQIMGSPRCCVDHKDGNGLNNQRSNLRCCTTSQNNRNSKIYRTNTSGFRGVVWSKKMNRWVAQIRVGGKSFYLGSYCTKNEAARVYDAKAKEVAGEFARLNCLEEK
jgi:hypothetical protein